MTFQNSMTSVVLPWSAIGDHFKEIGMEDEVFDSTVSLLELRNNLYKLDSINNNEIDAQTKDKIHNDLNRVYWNGKNQQFCNDRILSKTYCISSKISQEGIVLSNIVHWLWAMIFLQWSINSPVIASTCAIVIITSIYMSLPKEDTLMDDLEAAFSQFEGLTHAALLFIKRCELAKRGYKISGVLPPITRIEANEFLNQELCIASVSCSGYRKWILAKLLELQNCLLQKESACSDTSVPLLYKLDQALTTWISSRADFFTRVSVNGATREHVVRLVNMVRQTVNDMKLHYENISTFSCNNTEIFDSERLIANEEVSMVYAVREMNQLSTQFQLLHGALAQFSEISNGLAPSSNTEMYITEFDRALHVFIREAHSTIDRARAHLCENASLSQNSTTPSKLKLPEPTLDSRTIHRTIVQEQRNANFTNVYLDFLDENENQDMERDESECWEGRHLPNSSMLNELNTVLDCKKQKVAPEQLQTPVPEQDIDAAIQSFLQKQQSLQSSESQTQDFRFSSSAMSCAFQRELLGKISITCVPTFEDETC